jgi:hypothetical protein
LAGTNQFQQCQDTSTLWKSGWLLIKGYTYMHIYIYIYIYIHTHTHTYRTMCDRCTFVFFYPQ